MKSFYLTFDGAPNPPGTDNILEVLATHEVMATFFMEGHRLEGSAECAVRVLEAGHDVGNHTFSHQEFKDMPLESVLKDLEQADDVLYEKLGIRPRYCRPPFGTLTAEAESAILDLGYTIVLWSYSNRDWETPDADVLAERILNGLRDEAIIVMHDRVTWVPETLEIIIPAIRSQGYEFKKISEKEPGGILR